MCNIGECVDGVYFEGVVHILLVEVFNCFVEVLIGASIVVYC